MIKDGGVVIVDEFTGRLMPGRRWSDGLHQAVEAKEKVKIERENQTLATITFQNYFRKYKTLCGMTGTAETEASEFNKIYKLEVMVIPTNRPLMRKEEPDLIYRSQREKNESIVDDIMEQQAAGRPTLVGTVSIEKSERLSALLHKRGVKHVVLNAKYHAQEAEIVAQAGRQGKVTIATNMAGRGTDILLGGNAEHMGASAGHWRGACRAAPAGRGEVRRRRGVRLLLPHRCVLPRAARRVGAYLHAFPPGDRSGARNGCQLRWPAHPRHRAARGAADRQSAPRPGRPPGRPWFLAVLPVARRRPDADFRLRKNLRSHGAPRDGRGCSDRARHGH